MNYLVEDFSLSTGSQKNRQPERQQIKDRIRETFNGPQHKMTVIYQGLRVKVLLINANDSAITTKGDIFGF